MLPGTRIVGAWRGTDRGVAGGQDERGADRLLAEESSMIRCCTCSHQPLAEEADHGRVDPGRHDAECVAGGDEAVVRLQVLERRSDDPDARQPGEPSRKRRTSPRRGEPARGFRASGRLSSP